MVGLWVGIALLTLVAVAVLFYPLLRARARTTQTSASEDRQHQNVDIYRERLAELEAERAMGTLDQESFAVLKLELEKNLLIDAQQAQPRVRKVRPQGPQLVTVVLLALLIPVTSLGLYSQLGRSNDLARALNPPEMPTLEAALAQLEQELDRNPENAEGWYLLATTYLNQGRYDEAITAFRRVADLLPESAPQYAGVQGQIAQALYFQAGATMNEEVKQQIDRTLALDPQEMAALGLLGIEAYESARYEEAIQYWNQALNNASGQAAESLRAGINQARQQLAAAGKPVPDAPDAGPQLQVSVSIAPELADQLSPEDTLFIYARPVGGRMPLAAVRLKADQLPAEVTLDDSMAMTPRARLSGTDQVEVGARISASGDAIPAAGDLIGSVSPIDVGTSVQRVEVVIDGVVE
ncbi:c-type cytochrome biogenesis protein CcmI [Marinobacterium litorale]|uniref:c-type cytochrome biogenesis protein CcmI n=1 Tax=Marinobacterium litorale TaxID=404770 RepID=UPI000429AE84|nr:c-type cytochrome biogenesis protein CcmI [Marinobacterium litorale]